MSVRTFLVPFFGSGTVINHGSGSDFLARYGSGSGSASQKVTVPTVPVPQRWCKVPTIVPIAYSYCVPFQS